MLNRKTKLDMSTKDKLKNETANGTKPVLGAVLTKIKKWNWTLFLVIIVTGKRCENV